jgi:hypothetical protein
MAMRDTPPGENAALTGDPSARGPGEVDWPAIARAAFEASTNWLNGSRRAKWSDSLHMFQGEHTAGSKYLSNDYRYRSHLVRPKARATVRRAEASTATAFFGSDDLCSITAENEDDPTQVASARFMKELVNYRLTRTLPWFVLLLGARQDCEIYGLCISRQYWKYEERLIGVRQEGADAHGDAEGLAATDEFQYFEVTADHPDIILVAPDNFRFDPACDWTRPVESSPYLIERIPMYVGAIEERMAAGALDPSDPASWRTYDEATILGAKSSSEEATRLDREQHRLNSMQAQPGSVRDFEISWVHLNTIRREGRDWVFFTLGPDRLLTEPRLHVEVYGTERRPYRIGFTNLEAHRNYPASTMELLRDSQAAANDTQNMQLDAVKLALQPRPMIKSGSIASQHMADYRIFMPGQPFLVGKEDDVKWETPPDPSQSAFLMQDRINNDFDELAGGFSQGSVQTNRQLNETAKGMELIAGAAGTVGEYQLRLFVETWVKGVIEDLVDLEQRLEEDETVLALAGAKAQLVQRYGIDEITDWFLQQKITTKVNVGIGATNPTTRIANFVQIADVLGKLFGPAAALGLKFDEVCSEVFGVFGYADGKRFFEEGFDIKAAMQALKGQGGAGIGVDPHRLEEVQIKANTDLQATQMKTDSTERIAAMRWGGDPNQPDPAKLTEFQMKAAADMRISALQAASHERVAQIGRQREIEKQASETQRAMIKHENDLKGHVIRTLPHALAKLLVAEHHGATARQAHASAERIAKLRPRAA